MRMAKPTPRDIEAGYELHNVLATIDARFGGPWPTDGPDDLDQALMDGEIFCSDDASHLQALYNHLARLLRQNPNFYGRVIGGMCAVICNDRNQILDPSKDYLDLHPDLIEGLGLLAKKHADFIPSLVRSALDSVQVQIEKSANFHLHEFKSQIPIKFNK